MADTNTIVAYLQSHPDATDEEVAATLSTRPGRPRSGPITFTSLGALWGATEAATFRMGLLGASQQQKSVQLAAFAGYVYDLLCGPGFDPANAQAQAAAPLLTQAELCTPDQLDLVMNVYGEAQVPDCTIEQVAQARAGALVESQVRAWLRDFYNDAVTAIDAGGRDKATLKALLVE